MKSSLDIVLLHKKWKSVCVLSAAGHYQTTINPFGQLLRSLATYAESISYKTEEREFKKCCAILQVPENADQEQIRQSYIELAKKYHPDSGSSEASSSKFHQIDEAYKYFQKRFADFRHNRHKIEGQYGLYYKEKKGTLVLEQDDESSDRIKHTTPQHRQYLSYDGVGIGTPYQRQKDYQKYRASKAIENLHDHRVNKLTKSEESSEETALTKNRQEARKGATRYGFDRLVEDLIQESMAKGDFENLSGAGKPLKHTSSYNPHVDFTTHKLNQVLIENGFTPEWILLEKEIRTEIADIRKKLLEERHKYDKEMTSLEENELKTIQQRLKYQIEELNQKINKYNLVVPFLFKQIVSLDLTREINKVEKNYSIELRKKVQANANLFKGTQNKVTTESSHSSNNSNNRSFLSELFSYFMK